MYSPSDQGYQGQIEAFVYQKSDYEFSIDLCVICIQLNIGRDTVSNMIYV